MLLPCDKRRRGPRFMRLICSTTVLYYASNTCVSEWQSGRERHMKLSILCELVATLGTRKHHTHQVSMKREGNQSSLLNNSLIQNSEDTAANPLLLQPALENTPRGEHAHAPGTINKLGTVHVTQLGRRKPGHTVPFVGSGSTVTQRVKVSEKEPGSIQPSPSS